MLAATGSQGEGMLNVQYSGHFQGNVQAALDQEEMQAQYRLQVQQKESLG